MVMGLRELLTKWVASQLDILQRRSRHRLDRIAARLELVEGYIAAYLNLDRVIEIIRSEDQPKPPMIAEFALTDRQAEAILNMRLRSLRKLEEMQLRDEKAALLKEQDGLEKLLGSPARQRTRLKRDLTALRKDYAEDTPLGKRRTTIEEAAPAVEFSMDAMIEKEPVTVILSQKGWIKAAKGHADLGADGLGDFKFKEGDGPAFALHAQTTNKLLLAAGNGRFYTLGCDKLPGARGFGEPVRGMVDIDPGIDIEAALIHEPGGQLLVAASTGKGFAAQMDELLAETRKGRQVVNLKGDAKLAVVRRDPARTRSYRGCRGQSQIADFRARRSARAWARDGRAIATLQDGGLSDAVTLKLEDGLSWTMGGKGDRTRTETELWEWKVARGAAGRSPPLGFPRDNTFG